MHACKFSVRDVATEKTENILWFVLWQGGSLIDNAIVLCGPPTAGDGDGDSSVPFRPAYACAVDLFPDTPHCELVVGFIR